VRIGSNVSGNLQNVAFKTPSGKKILIVENDGDAITEFNIRFNGNWATATVSGGEVATFIW
jgi:glucosylceramidase